MIPRSLRNVYWKFRQFFENYYQHILVFTIAIAAVLGYLHFEMKNNSQDLNQSMDFMHFFHDFEPLFVLPILLILIFLMFGFVLVAINIDSMQTYNQLTHLQMRKRYADFLFIQLVTRIEQIEKKHWCDKEIISILSIIRAHEDIRKTIDKFRMNTKELLALSEFEELVPPEVYFADEEIRCSRFAHLSMEENIIRELASS